MNGVSASWSSATDNVADAIEGDDAGFVGLVAEGFRGFALGPDMAAFRLGMRLPLIGGRRRVNPDQE